MGRTSLSVLQPFCLLSSFLTSSTFYLCIWFLRGLHDSFRTSHQYQNDASVDFGTYDSILPHLYPISTTFRPLMRLSYNNVKFQIWCSIIQQSFMQVGTDSAVALQWDGNMSSCGLHPVTHHRCGLGEQELVTLLAVAIRLPNTLQSLQRHRHSPRCRLGWEWISLSMVIPARKMDICH